MNLYLSPPHPACIPTPLIHHRQPPHSLTTTNNNPLTHHHQPFHSPPLCSSVLTSTCDPGLPPSRAPTARYRIESYLGCGDSGMGSYFCFWFWFYSLATVITASLQGLQNGNQPRSPHPSPSQCLSSNAISLQALISRLRKNVSHDAPMAHASVSCPRTYAPLLHWQGCRALRIWIELYHLHVRAGRMSFRASPP